MGIVFKQSFRNTIITYLGFGIGAINTLFLYTNFLSDEYYGLVGFILSTSAILMPLLAFGVPNTMVKYYSQYRNSTEANGFLTLMLLLPLAIVIPCVYITYLGYEYINDFISKENSIVEGHVWYIFIIGLAMAYFEIFNAWAKVQMNSVFGNFMKEVFVRLGVSILLVLVYLDIISIPFFIKSLVGLYLLRTIIMKLYAYSIKKPVLDFSLPKATTSIINYSALIILGASASVIVLEIDRFMINQFIEIENVAYYGVAIFIATVIAVPSRSMHQITYPLTAELLNSEDKKGLRALYKKSSLTLLIVSGLIFILIISNLQGLYLLLPEDYRNGFYIVFVIGLVKVYDAVLGNNNAILYNSNYYRMVLWMGVVLAVLTIVFNLWLIPQFGVYGAATATFMAVSIYNTIKLIYVYKKFNILPFTKETVVVMLLLVGLGVVFYYIPIVSHPIISIASKGALITAIYLWCLYKFNISEDIHLILDKILKR